MNKDFHGPREGMHKGEIQLPVMKMMVSIVDRGVGAQLVEIFQGHFARFHFKCLGLGTASSEILDYLGLGETDKDVVFSIVAAKSVPKLLEEVKFEMHINKPGRGILFTLPISGICRWAITGFGHHNHEHEFDLERDEVKVENEKKYNLILTIVNQGYVDEVMHAAKEAGATGGTVLHCRTVGYEEAEKFFGITINPEKEIIAIIAPHTDKQKIMQAISHSSGGHSVSQGIVLSLPVNDIVGLG